MEEPEELEPNASIVRLMNRIRISRDKATILLILNQWNEHKFNSDFLLSGDYAAVSTLFVRDPQYNLSTRACHLCNSLAVCRNLGCGHYICRRCFRGFIESQILNGKLLLFCPYLQCRKFLSHDLLLHDLSEEAQVKYNLSLKNSQHPPEQDTMWKKLVSLFKSSATSLVELGRQQLRATIIANKEKIFVLAVVAAWKTIRMVRERRSSF